MKNNKLISILSVLLTIVLLLCACKKEEQYIYKTNDMLNITNTDLTLIGCKTRLENVLKAVYYKTNSLEEAHNKEIELNNPENYFLNTDYILTSFSPFDTEKISIIDNFTTDLNNNSAQEIFKVLASGRNIKFENNDNEYLLKFISEDNVCSYSIKYNESNDSFKYEYREGNSTTENILYFIEFINYNKNSYFIQDTYSRCYVSFDDNGNIIKYFSSTLGNNTNKTQNSIYDNPSITNAYKWVISKKQSNYLNIHIFEDNILTYIDNSSDSTKQIKIEADKYASALR